LMAMGGELLDRYRCPAGHSFLIAHVDGPHRPERVPCAFCGLWAEFTEEEIVRAAKGVRESTGNPRVAERCDPSPPPLGSCPRGPGAQRR